MKMKSLLSSNGVKHILFATFMLLPLISIFARTIYVQSNDNAYLSYSLNQSSEYTLIDNQSELKVDNVYRFSVNRDIYNSRTLQTINIEVGSFIVISGTNQSYYPTTKSFQVYYNGNNSSYSLHIVYNTNQHQYIGLGSYDNPSNLSFSFIPSSTQNNDNYLTNIQWVQFGEENHLDNAFEYSLSTFVEENNFNLNFFNWFDNVFLSFEGHNALYVNFINWYLNYALLVASVYLLFYVIYWFIDFVRGLLDKFSRKVGD